jgi:coenzyme F420-reducing hydrogenase delta subunit/Pyruvate/2-oxoacid:ferredoxin oxidoreductase delta subunit
VAFFHSLFSENHPFILAEVLSCAKTLQTEYDSEAFVFVSNLKVAQNGLEEQYQDCREAGVVFVKFQKSAPRVRQKADGNVEIEFYDEFIRETFLLKADVTVADEIVFPSPELERLSKILSIDTDAFGYAQTENVLRVGGRTNREGIFVVGPSAGPCSEETVFTDAANAVLNSLEVPGRIQTPITDVPEIDERCIRCLTCYRLCPYGAVALNTKVVIQPFACQKCGICVVECPRGAIHMKQTEQVRPTPKTGEKENAPFAPAIVAFCCSRSAARAAKVAGFKNLLPSGKIELKEVPCAGAISPGVILRAFTGGADGVLVLSCHRDNCHSETGNLLAESRVERIGRFFEETGLDSGRLWMKTLASNMEYEFSDICKRFGEQIVKLGPLGGSTA